MAKIAPPPTMQQLVEVDDKGKTEGYGSTQWLLFFNQLWTGDTGTDWSPTFSGLVTSGTPQIKGRYYRFGQFVIFMVDIVPSTSTTSTAGTTLIDNFPLKFNGNGVVFAVSGNLGDGPGMINAGDNKIYPPSWSAVTVPVTLMGIAEAR